MTMESSVQSEWKIKETSLRFYIKHQLNTFNRVRT
jgi:hypothetical protein